MNTKQYYLDIFRVSEGQLKTLTDTALAKGGDFSDLYFEHTTYFNLLLKDGVTFFMVLRGQVSLRPLRT